MRLAEAPGNVRLPGQGSGLRKPSVVKLSQVVTLDKEMLTSRAGRLGPAQMETVDRGLRLVLGLADSGGRWSVDGNSANRRKLRPSIPG